MTILNNTAKFAFHKNPEDILEIAFANFYNNLQDELYFAEAYQDGTFMYSAENKEFDRMMKSNYSVTYFYNEMIYGEKVSSCGYVRMNELFLPIYRKSPYYRFADFENTLNEFGILCMFKE